MKLRKWFSLLLAMTLIVSLVQQSNMTVFATEPSGTEIVDENASVPEVMPMAPEGEVPPEETLPAVTTPAETTPGVAIPDTSILPETTPGTTISPDTMPGAAIPPETTTPSNTTTETTTPAEATQETLILPDTPTSPNTAPEATTPVGVAPDIVLPPEAADNGADNLIPKEQTDVPTVISLFPYEEKSVSVYLNDYSKEQLAAMPVDTLLDMLLDRDGNKITVPADAEILCGYQKDNEGDVLDQDSFWKIERGGTVDLSSNWDGETSYSMQMIIGEAKQLAKDNIRYRVTVYINLIEEDIDYSIYADNGSSWRNQITQKVIWSRESSILGDIGIPVTEVSYYVESTPDFKAGDECYLNINSSLADDKNRNIDVKIYSMADFLAYHQQAALTGEITDILNQANLYQAGGHKGIYTVPDSINPLSSDNVFCIVYLEKGTGKMIAARGLIFIVRSGEPEGLTGGIYTYENGQMKDVAKLTYTRPNRWDSAEWKLDQNGSVIVEYDAWENEYRLFEGYASDGEYYHVLNTDDRVEKIVRGYYKTREEAEQRRAEDVTMQLMPSDRNTAPYGYKMNATEARSFTVFFKDGSVIQYYVYLSGNTNTTSYSVDFYVEGAVGYEDKVYDRISSEDSYYQNRYQMILINDTAADLSHLQPIFRTSNDQVKVMVGEEQKSGASVQDFSKGPVTYSVYVDGSPKQYVIAFAKKDTEAKLFVNGPDEREVFLTESSDYKNHDIVIANVGEKELTGLKAELIGAAHVKLDDYWTLGGAGNDILPPFTTINEKDKNGHYVSDGHLFNLAKIRLLPDGAGEITGTLKISADGQEPVLIKLKGFAGNPKIITESLGEGVKYVPYSWHIATNNMHDWIKVKLSLVSGKLPEGMTLNETTGEIYGVPKEAGEFPIRVMASYNRKEFVPSYASFTLKVNENTDDNVYGATDLGYEIQEHVGTRKPDPQLGTYHYVLTKKADQLFVSTGVMEEFVGFWLNGEKLVEGEDYTKESGSTRITIRRQTFEDKADQSGTNTIAAEFRVDGDRNNDLKRTAQNFQINFSRGGSGSHSSGGGSANAETAGGSADGSTKESSLATLVVRFIDAAGVPLSGLMVELHSTPKITQTNQNGIAIFSGVENGSHTLYVRNGADVLLAVRSLEVVFGDATSINGGQIIIKAGTASTLTIQLNGNELTLHNLQAGDPYQVLPASTGDTSNPGIWMFLSILLSSTLIIFGIRQRRKDKTVMNK